MKIVDSQLEAPLWHHIEDLRTTLVRIFLILLFSFFLCLFFYEELFFLFKSPLSTIEAFHPLAHQPLKKERVINQSSQEVIYKLPDAASISTLPVGVRLIEARTYMLAPQAFLDIDIPDSTRLFMFTPLSGISTTFKVVFWSSVVFSSPIWLALVIRFILPALHVHECFLLLPLIAWGGLSLMGGFLLGYKITLPFANHYLFHFNTQFGQNLWSLPDYVDFTLFTLLANGLACEMACILLLLVHYRYIEASWLQQYRRHAIIIAFIVGALLTPPDILTQILMAASLIAIYEAANIYARFLKTS